MTRPRRPVLLNQNTLESLLPTEDVMTTSLVADESAEILIGKRKVDKQTHDKLIELITKGDIEDVAILWANSPANCLAGLMWRSYIMYQWVTYDSKTVKKHFDNGLITHLENTSLISYEEVIEALNILMNGKFTEKHKDIFEFYADMAAFLRILANGVAFANMEKDEVIYTHQEASDMLVLKASSLLTLAREFEDASCAINTINYSHE